MAAIGRQEKRGMEKADSVFCGAAEDWEAGESRRRSLEFFSLPAHLAQTHATTTLTLPTHYRRSFPSSMLPEF